MPPATAFAQAVYRVNLSLGAVLLADGLLAKQKVDGRWRPPRCRRGSPSGRADRGVVGTEAFSVVVLKGKAGFSKEPITQLP